jgi:hypothetical protein
MEKPCNVMIPLGLLRIQRELPFQFTALDHPHATSQTS